MDLLISLHALVAVRQMGEVYYGEVRNSIIKTIIYFSLNNYFLINKKIQKFFFEALRGESLRSCNALRGEC